MQIDLKKIVREGGRLSASLSLGPLEWDRGSLLHLEECRLEGSIRRSQRGYEFQARLTGGVTLDCVRCLESYRQVLDLEFFLLFVAAEPAGDPSESQISSADCDLYPHVDGKVDLEPLIREQIYLDIPLKPVCRVECSGLCSNCGENLNIGPCRCDRPAAVRVV